MPKIDYVLNKVINEVINLHGNASLEKFYNILVVWTAFKILLL